MQQRKVPVKVDEKFEAKTISSLSYMHPLTEKVITALYTLAFGLLHNNRRREKIHQSTRWLAQSDSAHKITTLISQALSKEKIQENS